MATLSTRSQVTSQFPELSSHHMQLWVGDVERNILHELGKTLIEPQVVPPLHRHQVPEPLHRTQNSI